MGVELLSGREVLERLGTDLDDLHRETGTPVTARRPWLQSWVDSFPEHEPMAVVLRDAEGRIDAAALFATRRQHGADRIVALGDGPSDAAMFPARSTDAADQLAAAVANTFEGRGRAWQLHVRHLVPQDLVAPRLAKRFTRSLMVTGDVSPAMRVSEGASLREYVSKRHPGGIRRIRNRMTREGLAPAVEHLTAYDDVASLLPEMERIFRARDASLGRRSELDGASEGSFFRRVIEVHAARGEVSLTTLKLDSRLAAYTLCFLDGESSRMWNCRFDPAWSRYSAGKLAMDEAVEHAIASGLREFDFMRGEEPYKESYSNTQITAMDLHAWSGSLTRARSVAFLRARETARRMERAGGRPAALVGLLKRVYARLGRS